MATAGWRRGLSRIGIELRPGEGFAACALFLSFFLFITFQYTAKTVRQATFIDSLGFQWLPVVYFLVAACSYPVLRLYAKLADRMPRRHLIAGTCFTISASMVLFWWLFQFDSKWVPVAFYVVTSIIFVMTVSQFWSFANHVLDPRQAKRLFGFVGAGGLLGGVAGGQVARLCINLVGTRFALLAAGVIVVIVVLLVYAVDRRSPASDETVAGASGLRKLDEAKGGFDTIRKSRHLGLIAALLTLTVVVAQVVDLQFNWAVQESTTDLEDRGNFFGNFYTIMNISAFLFQLIFAARIHRSLGVGFAMRVLPVSMGIGTLGVFAAAVAAGPGVLLTAALVLKVGENGLRYSLDQATRELLFLPVPSLARLKAKAFIDVFIQRSAKGIAAVLLLPVTFGVMTALQAGWLSLGLIVIWLGVIVAMHREYIRSFRRGLRQRTVDSVVPINLADVTTLELLVQSLGSTDARQVLHSLRILSSHGRGNLVPPLLLYHDDPGVRQETLRVLAETGRSDAAPLVERRLGDEDPEVRAEAIRVLADLSREDVVALMLPRLKEHDPGVRASAIACLANHDDGEYEKLAGHALQDMLSDADPGVRAEAAKAIGAVREPKLQGQMIQLMYDGEPRVLREAISAIRRRVARDGFQPLYAPTLISMLNNRRVKHELREALVAFGEPVVPALVHFMNDTGEQMWVRRALPKTLARLGTPTAVEALIAGLDKPVDRFLRRKLIEALGSLEPQKLAPYRRRIEAAVHAEAGTYLGVLADVCSSSDPASFRLEGPVARWQREDDVPSLLYQLLLERMADHLRNLFGLLGLLHTPGPIWAAHESLVSGRAALRAHALEYLDNTLSGDVRRSVFMVIDDSPLDERMRRAAKTYGTSKASRVDCLGSYLSGDGDHDRENLTAAALYTVYTDRVAELYPRIDALLRQEDIEPFVRETAEWVARRLDLPAARS
jgi:AAA family ATP:ADP antiporter